jgi:hypothetical protein
MMGIVMPETWWAVSVRQSNKILRLLHLVGCFIRVKAERKQYSTHLKQNNHLLGGKREKTSKQDILL